MSTHCEGALSRGEMDVLLERWRQVSVEGWTPDHDDHHAYGEMAMAAVTYVLHAVERRKDRDYKRVAAGECWPWSWRWWKPKDPRRDLVRAAALILAEIDRFDRESEREAAR